MIEKYFHHKEVSVFSHLKGKHRAHCLCWQNCKFFSPQDPINNCEIAQSLYHICVTHNVTTPVFECAKYEG